MTKFVRSPKLSPDLAIGMMLDSIDMTIKTSWGLSVVQNSFLEHGSGRYVILDKPHAKEVKLMQSARTAGKKIERKNMALAEGAKRQKR